MRQGCSDLVSLETMYDFDPNFALQAGYSPEAGTAVSTAVMNGGVACSWIQQSSGDTIQIAAAEPSAATLKRLKTAATSAGTESTPGQFYALSGGVGSVQLFSGPYWIVATSAYFSDSTVAQPLLDSVRAALD